MFVCPDARAVQMDADNEQDVKKICLFQKKRMLCALESKMINSESDVNHESFTCA